MSLIKEFRDFAMRGNVIDLAVGVIIGASFGLLVKSLVDDILMPPIGYLVGGVDFSSFSYTLVAAEGDTKAVTISYGKFFNAVIAFMIQAAAIFMVIKLMNTAMKRFRAEEAKAAATPEAKPADVLLLEEIRDLLARKA
ncbi:MAG TPA: large conductance mechanosensitive channel protein MscL [Planctomycetaceae bacterium]|nr:large conductance mechanosensitive channel protein MscL [Planctomycetaceae bacterium]